MQGKHQRLIRGFAEDDRLNSAVLDGLPRPAPEDEDRSFPVRSIDSCFGNGNLGVRERADPRDEIRDHKSHAKGDGEKDPQESETFLETVAKIADQGCANE